MLKPDGGLDWPLDRFIVKRAGKASRPSFIMDSDGPYRYVTVGRLRRKTETQVQHERSWPKVLLVGLLFLCSFLSLSLVSRIPGYIEWFRGMPELVWWIENALRPLIPVVLGLAILYGVRPRSWANELGLDRPIIPTAALALLLTLPLTVGPLLLGAVPSLDHSVARALFGWGLWPLAEEINYRGFAFGQIYAYSGLGFWPAGLLSSALFGIGHMANAAAEGHELSGQIANALIVGGSALGLAWLYFRWRGNLWLVFFMHALGNLAGALYMSGNVAVGNTQFIVLLVVTLVLAVGVTLKAGHIPWIRKLQQQ
jgi:membrane protease YdiL (CAAX protease family)